MIAFSASADDAPQDRHDFATVAPSSSGLAANARGAVPADGTAGVGVRASAATTGGSGSDPDELAVDDLVTAAPLTGTVGYLYTFDADGLQT